jgi:hypothetical protein
MLWCVSFVRVSVTVVALRDIGRDEELSIDYGTVNSGVVTSESDNFTCKCGASRCRALVTSTDWRLPEVQHQYWPYFPPFVKRLILKEAKGKGAGSGMIGNGLGKVNNINGVNGGEYLLAETL